MEFYLESDGTLKYTRLGNKEEGGFTIVGYNILLYDYIVNEDIVYLVYLQNDGTLYYKTIDDEKISEAKIGKFDLKSNIYDQLNIIIVNDKPNLIYSFYNKMNPNIHSIQHVILSSSKENKYSVIKYVSKIKTSFVLDSDSKSNIHLFYNSVSNNFSYIYYTSFNPYKNQWLNTPVRISTSDTFCRCPNIFVDHMGNIHGIWWQKDSNGYILKYKRMSMSGTDMYKWKEVSLPLIVEENIESHIYELDDVLYIECENSILLSNDFGLTWAIGKKEKQNTMNNSLDNENTIDSDINETPLNIYNNTVDVDQASKLRFEVLLLNQEEIFKKLNDLIDNQELLKSNIRDLEYSLEDVKNSGFKSSLLGLIRGNEKS